MFAWERPQPLHVTHRIDADRRIYFISDLHLGDGAPSDAFFSKDRELVALIDRVRQEDAHLVIAGDAIDFHQAWGMSRVLKAHARLIGELARLAESHGVTYIWGNHDYDISLFKDLLRFQVCSRLEVGDQLLVQHGYEYDPFIGPNLDQTHVATRIHHLVERLLDTWIRLPLENFYTLPNRLAFWVFHKVGLVTGLRVRLLRNMGRHADADRLETTGWYWTQNQLGNPACMVDGIREALGREPFRWILCGHSHLPGRIELLPGKWYANTGSWTFNSAQYALWDGGDLSIQDWITGRVFENQAYRRVVEGHQSHMSFQHWWRENYLGWLRYRVGEVGRLPSIEAGAKAADDVFDELQSA